MPFASFGSIAEVARAYQIRCERTPFVGSISGPLGDSFRAELDFTLREVHYDQGEPFVCETLIYPLLREVWKPYRDALTLWSHQSIAFDADLCGVPDYIVARRSPLGALVFDLPYLLVVEAKRDDFTRGWGQCLAAMLAAQKLDPLQDRTLYGSTTNGRIWEFGRLQGNEFLQEPRLFPLQDLETLAATLHFVMSECRDQVAEQPVSI